MKKDERFNFPKILKRLDRKKFLILPAERLPCYSDV